MSPCPAVCPPLTPLSPQQYWQRPDGQPATREHLLMALADLDEILIRATYSTSTAVAAIADVAMDTAVPPQPGLPPAPEVEECRCPPGYHGLSCQVSPALPSATPSPPPPPCPSPHHPPDQPPASPRCDPPSLPPPRSSLSPSSAPASPDHTQCHPPCPHHAPQHPHHHLSIISSPSHSSSPHQPHPQHPSILPAGITPITFCHPPSPPLITTSTPSIPPVSPASPITPHFTPPHAPSRSSLPSPASLPSSITPSTLHHPPKPPLHPPQAVGVLTLSLPAGLCPRVHSHGRGALPGPL